MKTTNKKKERRSLYDKANYIKISKERPWYKHWKAGRQRCNDTKASNYKYYGKLGIRFLLTEEEVKKLWIGAKAWEFKEAQLSRKDHSKDYTYENCFFTEKKDNVGERNKRVSSRPILQLTLNNEIIKVWNSASEVQRILGFIDNNITACARNKIKSSHGFKWQYAEKRKPN
jgi:hypothetical protein